MLEPHVPEPTLQREEGVDPEHEAMLADSVGLALLVVLETLAPPERLAFVLHETFGVPFDEIATIVGRTPAAARQLASRARRRVRGASPMSAPDLTRQRQVIDAYLAALRAGSLEALLAVLDPEVVIHSDRAVQPAGADCDPWRAGGCHAGARALARRSSRAPGPRGRIGGLGRGSARQAQRGDRFKIADGKIPQIEVIGAPERLRQLQLAVLHD